MLYLAALVAPLVLASPVSSNASCATMRDPALAALCRAQQGPRAKVYCNQIADADLRALCKAKRD